MDDDITNELEELFTSDSDDIQEEQSFDSPQEKVESGPLGDGECVVCGAPTFRPEGKTRSGQRKRIPKYCEEHNPRNKVTKPDGPILASRLKALHTDLADNVRLVGALTGPVLPVTGYIILEDAEAFTQAALNLAKRHPKVLKALEKASQVGPGITVGRFMVKIGVAMNVDSGRMRPESPLSNMMGVYEAWKVVHPDLAQQNGSVISEPPPHYSVIQ